MLRQIFLVKLRNEVRTINQLVLQKSAVAYEKPRKIVDMVFRRTQVKKRRIYAKYIKVSGSCNTSTIYRLW